MPVSLPERSDLRKKIRTTTGNGNIWAPAIFLLTPQIGSIILSSMSIYTVKKTKADAYSFWCSRCEFDHSGECVTKTAPKPPAGPCPGIPQVGSVWHFDSQMKPSARYHHKDETYEVVSQQKEAGGGILIEMRSVQTPKFPSSLVPIQCWSEDGWPFLRYDKLWMIP
jgi:hypothetical protein